jgi:hypothetical protein
MLKLLDITQTTFNAAIVVYEAVYEAVSAAVSEVVSEAASDADIPHFHELSRKIN